MSLILEALRKLEREGGSQGERGFVVLGSPGSGGRGGLRLALLAAFAALLVGALGASAWHRFSPRPAPPGPPAATPVYEVVRTRPTPARAPRTSSPEPTPVAAAGGPEPKDPEPAPAAPHPRFRLQAITLRDGRPVAILDGRLVREGDSFEGVRVVRIGDLEIELETPDGRLVVGF
jgi:hypothetical protein